MFLFPHEKDNLRTLLVGRILFFSVLEIRFWPTLGSVAGVEISFLARPLPYRQQMLSIWSRKKGPFWAQFFFFFSDLPDMRYLVVLFGTHVDMAPWLVKARRSAPGGI